MAWAFRRRIKVIPGVYINLSKGGLSASAGMRGASLTFRSDGGYRNLGLPGTGLYSRQKVGHYGGGTASQEPDQALLPDKQFDEAAPDYDFISADGAAWVLPSHAWSAAHLLFVQHIHNRYISH